MPGQFAAAPIIENITLTDANKEYPYVFPNGTTHFEFQARTSAAVRFAFVAGVVATPTGDYGTLKADDAYSSFNLWGSQSLTLYLASASAGTIVEIVTWT